MLEVISDNANSLFGVDTRLRKIFNTLGYKFFFDDKKPYDLTLFGIRNSNRKPDAWDDLVGFLRHLPHNRVQLCLFPATTDPGAIFFGKPINSNGTALLVPGQHKAMWTPGMHKGKHPALVQNAPVPVYRDNDKDFEFDLDKDTIETGMFGINGHAAYRDGLLTVGPSSAGCQVFRVAADTARVLHAVREQGSAGLGLTVSYTLLDEREHPELEAVLRLIHNNHKFKKPEPKPTPVKAKKTNTASDKAKATIAAAKSRKKTKK